MKKFFTRMLVLLLAATSLCLDVAAASIVTPVPAGPNPDPATVQSAVNDFINLPSKEKKHRLKEAKKALKEWKAQKRAGEPVVATGWQILFAILIPPLGVYLHEGTINNRFWIDLILTLLFYVPGLIYALIVILGEK